jgi:hypothetical protein
MDTQLRLFSTRRAKRRWIVGIVASLVVAFLNYATENLFWNWLQPHVVRIGGDAMNRLPEVLLVLTLLIPVSALTWTWIQSRPETLRVGPTGNVVNERQQSWIGVAITNPNPVPLRECYGQLQAYTLPNEGRRPDLPLRLHFPWTTHGGTGRVVCNLGPHQTDVLDIAVTDPNKLGFYLLAPHSNPDGSVRVIWHFEQEGHYTFTLDVGAKGDSVDPARYVLRLLCQFVGHQERRTQLTLEGVDRQ